MPVAEFRHLRAAAEQGVLVLTLTTARIEGEHVADVLLQELLAALAVAEAPKVVVDFQRTQYLSSVAFRSLFRFRRKVLEAGGRLVLCGLNPVVGDVFYTTRLISTSPEMNAPFMMEPDLAAAVARLINS